MDDPGPGGHHGRPPPWPGPVLAEALLGSKQFCREAVVVLVSTEYVLDLILDPARLLLHLAVNRGPVLSWDRNMRQGIKISLTKLKLKVE